MKAGRFSRGWCRYNKCDPNSPITLDVYVHQVVQVYEQDWQLVAKLKAQDDLAWKRLREAAFWQCLGYLLARGWQGNALIDQAEVLAQDGLLRVWAWLDCYFFDVRFAARWHTVVRHVWLDFYRKNQREAGRHRVMDYMDLLQDVRSDKAFEQIELRMQLQDAIDQLASREQQQAILFELQEDLSAPAIAQHLGTSVQAVYNLRHRARERLRSLLA